MSGTVATGVYRRPLGRLLVAWRSGGHLGELLEGAEARLFHALFEMEGAR